MKRVIFRASVLCILSTVGLVSGCGGGGGGSLSSGGAGEPLFDVNGNSNPAAIDDRNVAYIGQIAGEAVNHVSYVESLPQAAQVVELFDFVYVQTIVNAVSQGLLGGPGGLVVSADVCSVTGESKHYGAAESGRLVQRVTYGDCGFSAFGRLYRVNGTVVTTYTDSNDINTRISTNFRSATITNEDTGSVMLSHSACSDIADVLSCSISEPFRGTDGAVHEISDYQDSGASLSGLDGSATVIHHLYGAVTITFSNIMFGKCGNVPDEGSIAFISDNGSSGTANFEDGCSLSGTWNNGSTSGVFLRP